MSFFICSNTFSLFWPIYTLSFNFFERLDSNEFNLYYFSILSMFANDQSCHKIAIDKDAMILERYRDVKKHGELLFLWIQHMADTRVASRFLENTNVDISSLDNDEKMCLEICDATQEKKLIVYSKSSFPKNIFQYYQTSGIKLLDKDEASTEINTHISISDSIIAGRDVKKSHIN